MLTQLREAVTAIWNLLPFLQWESGCVLEDKQPAAEHRVFASFSVGNRILSLLQDRPQELLLARDEDGKWWITVLLKCEFFICPQRSPKLFENVALIAAIKSEMCGPF